MNLPVGGAEQRAFFKAETSGVVSPYSFFISIHKISFRSEGRSSNSNGGLLLANFKRPESNAMIKNIRNKYKRRKFRFFVAYEFTKRLPEKWGRIHEKLKLLDSTTNTQSY